MSKELRYNEVSMKASHNSYAKEENIVEQLVWNPKKDYNSGCRALEFDIRQSDDGQAWSVEHLALHYRENDKQLREYLTALNLWSHQNPDHDVITIFLDLKKTTGEKIFPVQLDSYIKACIPAQHIYTPGNILKDGLSLAQSVEAAGGMPLLKDLQGKFIFCLAGNEEDKQLYLNDDSNFRSCFVEQKVLDTENMIPFSEDHIFFGFHIYSKHEEHWATAFYKDTNRVNVIVRAYILDRENIWKCALDNGCNILSTDKVSRQPWAKVGNSPFVQKKTLENPDDTNLKRSKNLGLLSTLAKFASK